MKTLRTLMRATLNHKEVCPEIGGVSKQDTKEQA
jgi:hypothetical protein